jgi:hypothetical protein
MITSEKFTRIVNLVIDKMEGGYYHPQMLKDGRIKDSRYAGSGETMFGIDRLNGGTINTSTPGKAFWSIIDKAGAAKSWAWNYFGGQYRQQLKALAGGMMFPLFSRLFSSYLNPEAQSIVASDNRLLFHFVYATWNGSGWFQKFAKDINTAVFLGKTNPNVLVQVALDSRMKEGLKPGSKPSSLISQGGKKIAGFINSDPLLNEKKNPEQQGC